MIFPIIIPGNISKIINFKQFFKYFFLLHKTIIKLYESYKKLNYRNETLLTHVFKKTQN